MQRWITIIFLVSIVLIPSAVEADDSLNWPQASGPNRNFQVSSENDPPIRWSVVRDHNIRWRTTLPEGGQSAVTIWGDWAFVTTHREIEEGAPLTEPNMVGYCLDAGTGEILWKVDVPGTDPVQTAGIFSDATVFAPVTDGEHVWFFNRCGAIGCFDFKGKQKWLREFLPRPRHTNRECEPVLVGDTILTVEVRDKAAGQQLKRHKPVPEGIDPRDVWTYLHGIDKKDGSVKWVGQAGTAVHNSPMVHRRSDGSFVIAHGRGGGHGPLETPYGVSLTDLGTGKTLWSYETGRSDSSYNTHVTDRYVFWFTGKNHLVLDASSGELLRKQNVMDSVTFTKFDSESKRWTTTGDVQVKGKKMPNTNQTNIVVGEWHYFLAHDEIAIARVHIETGRTEYLEVPAQLVAHPDKREDRLIWSVKEVVPNDTRNSRGIDIAPDKRAKRSGWGHVSAASPVVVGSFLFAPVMNGTVYVIDTRKEVLDQSALVALNDLGPAGETWTLASFSFSKGRLYMHTMKEIICIGESRQ